MLPGRRHRPRLLALGLLAASCVAGAGCRDRAAERAAPDPTPQRVVVIAPAGAEMLESLDLLDRVVGVGQFGPWPGTLGNLPVAGGYNEPNVETVLGLRADAVVSAKSQAAVAAHRRLEALGVRVLELDTSTHDGVFAALAEVGRAFDRETRADEVARSMRESIADVERRAVGVQPRRVLFVVGRDPMYVAGPGSHIDRMIAGVGGTNIAHDAASPYQQVSLEAMLERMPEVIIDTSENGDEATRGRTPGAWARWEFLPAVREDRVHHVDPSQLVIPGMRLPEMTRLMGRLVHPEIFGAPEAAQYGPWAPGPERTARARTP